MEDNFKFKDLSSRSIVDLLEKGVWGKEKVLFTNVDLFDFAEDFEDIEDISSCIEVINNYNETESCLLSLIRNDLFDMLRCQPEYMEYEVEDEDNDEFNSFAEIIEDFLYQLNLNYYSGELQDFNFKELIELIYDYQPITSTAEFLKEKYVQIIQKNRLFGESLTDEFKKLAESYIDALLLAEDPRESINRFVDELD